MSSSCIEEIEASLIIISVFLWQMRYKHFIIRKYLHGLMETD